MLEQSIGGVLFDRLEVARDADVRRSVSYTSWGEDRDVVSGMILLAVRDIVNFGYVCVPRRDGGVHGLQDL